MKTFFSRKHWSSFLLAGSLFSANTYFTPVIALAQSTSFGSRPKQEIVTFKILGVDVEGNTFADAQTIIALSGLNSGDVLTTANFGTRIQDAVRSIWRRRQFSDVDISIEKLTDAGIFLKIRVKEFPRLSEIIVRGNAELKTEEIRKASGKLRGDILSVNDVFEIERDIKKLYDKESMPFAKVSSKIVPSDTIGFARLEVDVIEGNDFYVENIQIRGSKKYSSDDLAGKFDDTKTKTWWQFWKSAKFNKAKYETDKEKLVTWFKNNGFIDAEIASDSVRYDETTGKVYIAVDVREGQQFYIRNIDFTGNLVYPTEVLRQRLNFQKGEVYDLERFRGNLTANQDQTDVTSMYANIGYLMARLEPEEKRIGKDSIDITIRVNEGTQFTVRKVEIVGNTKTKDQVIRRELFTRPGDYFNRGAVIRSVRGLGVLNYFNPEALRPDVRPVDKTQVDLVYKVEERSNDTFNASVGFAGAFGLTGSIGITLNNFSIAEPLSGGGGQIFNFQWQFGQANSFQTFSLGLTEPWLMGSPTTVGFNLFDTRQNFVFQLRQTGASINLGRRFRWPDDYFRGDWIVRFSRNEVPLGSSTIYAPGINTEISLLQSFSRINLDNVIFPTEGSRFTLSNQVALGSIGVGTTDFLKTDVNFEFFQPLLKIGDMNRLVLMLSTQYGYVTPLRGTDSSANIPAISTYFMGGNGLGGFSVTPLRGYLDRQVGPTDASGNIIGGKLMSRYVAELRFALALNPVPIYLIGFAEAGNVWRNMGDADPFNLRRSAGVGVRMMLNPIGLLGFDYGYGFDPLRERGTPSGWQFHFQFGR